MICIGKDSANMRPHSFRLLLIAVILLSILIVSNAVWSTPSIKDLGTFDGAPLAKDGWQVSAPVAQMLVSEHDTLCPALTGE